MKAYNMKKAIQLSKEIENAYRTLKDDKNRLLNVSNANKIALLRERIDRGEEEFKQASVSYHEAIKPLKVELDSVQAKCRERIIDIDTILNHLDWIERKVNVPKKALEGTTVDIDVWAQDFPAAYKRTPESTQFKAVYKSGSWRITDIERCRTRRRSQQTIINLSESAKEGIIARFETGCFA